MTSAYNPARSRVLVEASYQTYEQYKNQGSFTPPDGYEQVAAFQAPELLFEDPNSAAGAEQRERFLENWRAASPKLIGKPVPWERLQELRSLASTEAPSPQSAATEHATRVLGEFKSEVATLTERFMQNRQWPFTCRDVYTGFALKSLDPTQPNIVALRGTQTAYEWVIDATAQQIKFNPLDANWGRVHLGFYIFYRMFLSVQIMEACLKHFIGKPIAVTGHSLGAALAVLTATDLRVFLGFFFDGVEMYNYAGPRVGDPTFVDFYNQKVPASYRVVNLADVVPILPPTTIFGDTFGHVGTEWSYLWQAGDVTANHAIQDNYKATVEEHSDAVTDASRSQPTSCICE